MDSLRTRCVYLALFFLCSLTVQNASSSQHNGTTVDHMLSGYKCKEDCTPQGGADELCWGYEKRCSKERRLFVPQCEGPAKPWSTNIEGKAEDFWKQGDFGYVKKEMDSLTTLCKPQVKGDSMLKCSENMRYCRARNLYIDFRRFKEMSKTEGKYKSFLEDIFQEGEVGGHCDLNSDLLRSQGEHKSPLQSWYAELERYTNLTFQPGRREGCDEVVTKPTVFIKLDAGNKEHRF